MPRQTPGIESRTMTLTASSTEVWDAWVSRMMLTIPEGKRQYLTQGRLVIVAIEAANAYLDMGGLIEILNEDELPRNPRGRYPHWYHRILD